MPQDIINSHSSDFQDVLEFLKLELGTLRTGRASASLVETIPIEAYGARSPLKSLASISVPDARTITIECGIESITEAGREAGFKIVANRIGSMFTWFFCEGPVRSGWRSAGTPSLHSW